MLWNYRTIHADKILEFSDTQCTFSYIYNVLKVTSRRNFCIVIRQNINRPYRRIAIHPYLVWGAKKHLVLICLIDPGVVGMALSLGWLT